MPSATRTIAIDRSPDDVFAFFSDPANDQRWRGHVKEIAAEGTPGVGRHVHQLVEGPGGRGIAADIEVTAYDPPSHYAFQVVAGPARPRGEFTVTPTGTVSTRRRRSSRVGTRRRRASEMARIVETPAAPRGNASGPFPYSQAVVAGG